MPFSSSSLGAALSLSSSSLGAAFSLKELGCVVLLADGNADSFERLGQLDASDWSVAGAGDFDGDGKDDLLVRQTSTGIAGAYASADMSRWSTVTSDYLLA